MEGLSISAARRRYGITDVSTIKIWLMQLATEHLKNTVIRVEMKARPFARNGERDLEA